MFSSFITGVGYDADAQVLTVKIGRRTYEYTEVPEQVFNGFIQAESRGTYFNNNIKGSFRDKAVA